MKTCPKCQHSPLDYYGLSKNPGGEDMFPTYRCGKCRAVFVNKIVQNPGGTKLDGQRLPKSYGNAIRLFEEFSMKPADKIITANISLPDNNKNPLVWLGKVSEITYVSNKEGKENQRYTHDLSTPYPDLLVTQDGKTFLICGGRLHIEKGWLYD